MVLLLPLVATIAGGGRRKDISREGGWDSFSPVISVDDTGVGGIAPRGISRADKVLQMTVDPMLRDDRVKVV